MSKKQNKIIIFVLLILTITVFSFLYNSKKTVSLSVSPKADTVDNTEGINKENPSLVVVAGDETFNLSITEGVTLYDALMKAERNGEIVFTGREYLGLGFFVKSIGSLAEGDGKNLIYYINGKQAEVGVSSYVPQKNDIITWKLE